jgi:hypothetical protein
MLSVRRDGSFLPSTPSSEATVNVSRRECWKGRWRLPKGTYGIAVKFSLRVTLPTSSAVEGPSAHCLLITEHRRKL